MCVFNPRGQFRSETRPTHAQIPVEVRGTTALQQSRRFVNVEGPSGRDWIRIWTARRTSFMFGRSSRGMVRILLRLFS